MNYTECEFYRQFIIQSWETLGYNVASEDGIYIATKGTKRIAFGVLVKSSSVYHRISGVEKYGVDVSVWDSLAGRPSMLFVCDLSQGQSYYAPVARLTPNRCRDVVYVPVTEFKKYKVLPAMEEDLDEGYLGRNQEGYLIY